MDNFIKSQLTEDDILFANLPSCWVSENPMLTIPPEVLITSARPDMVYINNKKLVLIELTVPSNTIKNLEDVHKRKCTK